MTQYASQIQLPKEAFRKARHEYFNWYMAWAREILQNSYDAVMKTGGGRIDFNFDQPSRSITVTDTGIGMDADTLQNVLLCWAGSNKKMGDGSVGGFGYAKNLLYFANERFQIWSRDNYVVGEGGRYTNSVSEHFAGTRSTVEFETDHALVEIRRHLLSILCLFDPECPLEIYIDGEQQPTGQDSHMMQTQVTAPFGDLWFFEERQAEHDAACVVTVRIKGLPMFSLQRRVSSSRPLHGVLDIHPDEDLMALLTANRDSFRGSSGERLGSMMEELANNRSAAKMGERFTFVLNQYLLEEALARGEVILPGSEVSTEVTVETSEVAEQLASAETNLPNFPANFTISSGYRLNTKEGRSVIRYIGTRKSAILAHTWREVVKHVLASGAIPGISYHTALGEVDWEENDGYGEFRYHGTPVHMGFVFEEELEGNLCRVGYTSYSVNMNPNLLWQDWMLGDLIDLAAHEITHLSHASHNEQFIIMLDEVRKHLRRYTDEASLNRWIDQHLRTLGLRGRK